MENSQGLKLDTYGEWMKWTWNDSFKRERTHKGDCLMRKFLAFLFAFVLAFSLINPVFANEEEPSKLTGTVISVTDGDTFKVRLDNGKTETVRLILVDTPETKHPSKPVQPCGPEAYEFTKRMVSGKKVTLELDVQERDKYGRLLAYVYVGGKSVQESLLAEGLAKVAVYPPNVKYVDKYRAIEQKAKAAKKGIWADKPCAEDDGKD